MRLGLEMAAFVSTDEAPRLLGFAFRSAASFGAIIRLSRGRNALKTAIMSVMLLFTTVGSAQAGDAFVEGGVGLSYGLVAEVAYDDPVGSLFTVNARDGTRIVPQRLRRTPWSSAAALSLGYRFGRLFFARATYRHFGSQEVVADGFFFFNPTNPSQVSATFPQHLSTTAHGVFLGTGIEFDLGEAWFADLSLEA